jgi:uncharacterized glyoxalase superfamily protein PhnB
MDLVGIVVQNMAESLKFYRALGLDIPPEMDHEPHAEISLPGGLRLAWDALDLMKSLYPEWETPAGHRITIAFRCESAADVDQVHARLVGFGHQSYRAPWDAFWGQRYAVVVDPDGNLVDLFATL